MTASLHTISNHLAHKPILLGSHDAMALVVYNGDNVPDMLAGQYARLAYSTLGAFPSMLLHFDFDRILTKQNLLVFVREDEELLSGAYAVREL